MSCSTGYVVRDRDGAIWVRWEKYGTWMHETRSQRAKLVRDLQTRGARVDDASSSYTTIDACTCRGVLLDLIDRRYRFYACAGAMLRPAVGWLECLERGLARAPAWAGWDVAYAWGGREEFAALLPGARHTIAPFPADELAAPPLDELDAHLCDRDDWFVRWDADARALRCRYEPWGEDEAVLSVIGPELDVVDYTFAYGSRFSPVLRWLLHGPALLDAVLARAPYPAPYETSTRHGVVVDVPERRLHYWSCSPTPPRSLAQIRAAWPGWDLARLPHGFANHLAVTGRDDPLLRIDADTLASRDRFGQPAFDRDWIRERASLPLDPRPLRHVTVDDTWEDASADASADA